MMCVCIFESPPNNPALTKFKEKKENIKYFGKSFVSLFLYLR